MISNKKFVITSIVVLLVIVGFSILLVKNSRNDRSGKYDQFASCLTEKGAKFYGAFWCPHCRTQKKMFGKSIDKVTYIECSTSDGKNQLDVCKEAGIQSYPTWTFSDGSKETGEVSFEKLSEKTGCQLP